VFLMITAARVAERTGLDVLGAVPFDPEVGEADRLGRAVLDHAPDGQTATAHGRSARHS
jgi:CO dehydrogenase maturation factor